jgi:hypothetical protein
LKDKLKAPVPKTEITGVGILSADLATPLYLQKLTPISPKSDGRSVGTVRSRTEATEFVWCLVYTGYAALFFFPFRPIPEQLAVFLPLHSPVAKHFLGWPTSIATTLLDISYLFKSILFSSFLKNTLW